MSHTKGKWKLERGRNRYYENPDEYHTLHQTCFYICGPQHDSHFVADVIVEKSVEGKANARLIAAAPELLEACKNSPASNMFTRFAKFAEECTEKPSMAVYKLNFMAMATFLRSCENNSQKVEAAIAKAEEGE